MSIKSRLMNLLSKTSCGKIEKSCPPGGEAHLLVGEKKSINLDLESVF
jgi:hypothetical protein